MIFMLEKQASPVSRLFFGSGCVPKFDTNTTKNFDKWVEQGYNSYDFSYNYMMQCSFWVEH